MFDARGVHKNLTRRSSHSVAHVVRRNCRDFTRAGYPARNNLIWTVCAKVFRRPFTIEKAIRMDPSGSRHTKATGCVVGMARREIRVTPPIEFYQGEL